MNPNRFTHSSRSVRVIIAVAAAVLIWFVCATRLNHRCLLGYKWLELSSPALIAVFGAISIIFIRRLWFGFSFAAAIFLAFFQGVVPAYLAWIHGPNHPPFPGVAAETSRFPDVVRDEEDGRSFSLNQIIELAGTWAGDVGLSPIRLQAYNRAVRIEGEMQYKFVPRHTTAWRTCMLDQKQNMYARICAAYFLLNQDEEARAFITEQLASTNLRYRYNAAGVLVLYVDRDATKRWALTL